jgi:hypothetical protein
MTTTAEAPLSAEAEHAWLAYQAMVETKKIYFDFLQELDQKYDKSEPPAIAENLKMEQLLQAHDEKVSAFNKAMANVEEPSARQALMTKLTKASAATGAH